jgi:MFS family permease
VVAVALVLVVWFDLQPVGALDDDWGYWYSVRELVHGHGLRWFPTDSAIHLVQTLWSAALSLGSTDPVRLRLTALPFLGLALAMLWLLSRDLGASRFWSGVAAGALLTTPLVASVAVSFLTDVFYAGLLLLALFLGLRWAEGAARGWLLAVTLMACALQRQHGVLLFGFLVAVLYVRRRRGRLGPGDLVLAGAVLAFDLGTVVLPLALGTATEMMRTRASALAGLTPTGVLTPVLVAPTMLGWFALPFLGALAWRRPQWSPASALLVAVLVAATVLVVQQSLVAQGPWQVKWSLGGVGPWSYGGPKHVLPGFHRYFGLFALLLPPALAVMLWHARPWLFEGAGLRPVLLGVAALTQILPTAQTGPLDRYWIAVLAPILPVLAVRATLIGAPLLGKTVAIVVMTGNLAVWAAAEQDYLAWQAAADSVARTVYQTVPPDQVSAGYEENTVYAAIPYYDRFGSLPHTAPGRTGIGDAASFLLFGPSDPRVRLCFADRGDPRAGEDYRSLSPGRMISTPGPC